MRVPNRRSRRAVRVLLSRAEAEEEASESVAMAATWAEAWAMTAHIYPLPCWDAPRIRKLASQYGYVAICNPKRGRVKLVPIEEWMARTEGRQRIAAVPTI